MMKAGLLSDASWQGIVLTLLYIGSGMAHAAGPDWAFLSCAPSSTPPATEKMEGLPGSKQHYSGTQISSRASAIDWFPDSHEPMPAVLAEPRKTGQIACGYCHLPDGTGRPENAKLAGLPQAYILSQLEQIHVGDRNSAQEGYLPLALMRASVEGLTAEEMQAAAGYYSRQAPRSFEHVVEADRVPASVARCFVLARTAGVSQLLGERIVELVDRPDRFELRDPRTTYTAYVPRHSLSRGRVLVNHGRAALAACSSCHGSDLRGGAGLSGPPLAGRFTGYLARQLYGFKSGARHGPAAQPMQTVAAMLSDRDLIDVAAYAASLRP